MKLQLTLFILLFQPLFLIASAMNDTSVPIDSLSVHKIIILNDGTEYRGKILSYSKDTLNIITDNGINILLPSGLITNIYNYDNEYYSHNTIYTDAGFFFKTYYFNINYERFLSKTFSLRFGYGYAQTDGSLSDEGAKEGEILSLLCNFLLYKGESKLEIGLGATYYWNKTHIRINNNYREILERTYSFTPAICYRFQPKNGGLIFRTGFSVFYPGGGINFSIGYAF